MKTTLKILFASTLLSSAITACGPQVQTFAPQQVTPQLQSQSRNAQMSTRSDQVLDLVAQRFREHGFQQLDQNKDGFVSLQESNMYVGPSDFHAADSNQDGRLSFEEATTFSTLHPNSSRLFMNRTFLRSVAQGMWNQMNTNGDQVLTLDEVVNHHIQFFKSEREKYEASIRATQYFNQADLNLDRALNFSECEDAYARSILVNISVPLQN